jgi:hypothetical protein
MGFLAEAGAWNVFTWAQVAKTGIFPERASANWFLP